jgi:peptide deformylase
MSERQSDKQWIAGQAHPKIVTVGDPLLKAPTESISDVGAARALFDELVDLLRALNGAGLAAPQIGRSLNAIVVEVRKTDVFPDRPESPLIIMVNPVIQDASPEMQEGWEGCFSVPGLMGLVPRHQRIGVRFLNADGTESEGQYSGYLARVIQHEIDHLSRIEFMDRMTSMDSITTVANYLRFHHPATQQTNPSESNNSRSTI